MTLMQHFSGLANILKKAEQELKAHILALASHLSLDGNSIKVQISPGLAAEVNPKTGQISVNNAEVSDVSHLISTAQSLGKELEKNPAGAVAELSPALKLAEAIPQIAPEVKAVEIAAPVVEAAIPLIENIIEKKK